ncbi:hypothetical protein [Methylomarinovum tepidoasis]|nr:hypothetical protein [Methylomarinovum sp. IN45]
MTRWRGDDPSPELIPAPCCNSVSRERFETRGVLRLGAGILYGCDRALH